jgi:hypothetical protein
LGNFLELQPAHIGHGRKLKGRWRENGWSRKFAGPIPLPHGKPLVTLRDAGNYIAKLPKNEQQAAEWQTAAKVLMLIGEHGGDPMMARIAMMQALHRHEPEAAPAPRRKRARAYRIVR